MASGSPDQQHLGSASPDPSVLFYLAACLNQTTLLRIQDAKAAVYRSETMKSVPSPVSPAAMP